MINLILQETGVLFTLAFFLVVLVAFLAYLTARTHSKKVTTGSEGLIGETGEYKGDGQILVRGERWHIVDDGSLSKGDSVKVTGVDRLKLIVKRV